MANKKMTIIASKGTLDMAYPGLILANAARMSGIEATMFFTFWGLDIVTKRTVNELKLATVGNPGMHMPTIHCDSRILRTPASRCPDW